MVVSIRALGMILIFALCPVAIAAKGEAAPDGGPKPGFALPDSAGSSVRLGPRARGVTIVHFFATSCEACRDELPAFRRLVRRLAGKPVAILAVSVGDGDLRVRRFIDATPVNFPVLVDRDGAVARAWSVYSLPTTYIVDGAMRPRFVAEHEVDWDNIAVPERLWSSKRSW